MVTAVLTLFLYLLFQVCFSFHYCFQSADLFSWFSYLYLFGLSVHRLGPSCPFSIIVYLSPPPFIFLNSFFYLSFLFYFVLFQVMQVFFELSSAEGFRSGPHCKETIPKIRNIPRKGIARLQSQFPHSCACERFIYSHHWSAYSAVEKYVDRSWE